MGEIADLLLDQEMFGGCDLGEYIDVMYGDYKLSHQLENKVKRYSVSDEEIKDFLFRISVKHLCELTDMIIMEYDIEDFETQATIEKMIDIAAWGLTKKQLSNKQLWCLGSFVLYYVRELDL